jgi:hypothetical protein
MKIASTFEPANTVIQICGGVVALAKGLNLQPSTVRRWTYDRSRGGTGGFIPGRQQERIMRWANERGLPLKWSDFSRAAEDGGRSGEEAA